MTNTVKIITNPKNFKIEASVIKETAKAALIEWSYGTSSTQTKKTWIPKNSFKKESEFVMWVNAWWFKQTVDKTGKWPMTFKSN